MFVVEDMTVLLADVLEVELVIIRRRKALVFAQCVIRGENAVNELTVIFAKKYRLAMSSILFADTSPFLTASMSRWPTCRVR